MNNEKEKTIITPNECSLGRWLLTLLVGALLGVVIAAPFYLVLFERPGAFMGIPYETMLTLALFFSLFVGTVIALKLLAKTSLKDFILGVGGRINKKECLVLFGLYLVGFALSYLIFLSDISQREGFAWDRFVFLLGFMLLTVFFQTTYEELLFRGVFIRLACKNKVGYTKKAWIAAAVTTVLFMIAHAENPEVLTRMGGLDIVLTLLSYCIPGFAFFLVDMHVGNLMPSILLHWVNNFLLLTIISDSVSAIASPTLLLNAAGDSAARNLLCTVIAFLPVLIYVLIDLLKRKRAAKQ